MAVTDRAPDSQEVAGPNAQPKAPIDVDFAALKSVNSDVVGWIYVEALDGISYPIVQGKDTVPESFPALSQLQCNRHPVDQNYCHLQGSLLLHPL